MTIKPISLLLTSIFALGACAPNSMNLLPNTNSLVAKHGRLKAENSKIVDENGNKIQLSGVSWFWSNTGWGQEKFFDKDVVDYFVEDWNASLIRVPIGAMGPGSYLEDPSNLKRLETVVDRALSKGVYVIIDWHSHRAEDNTQAAIDFFALMSKKYSKYTNIMYEIYNEPLNTADWDKTVKPYSEKLIATIRANDAQNMIIIGTPTWSQDVDIAAKNRITGYNNIAYTMHFYAGTHRDELRKKTKEAIDAGLSIFVTEYGTVSANGDGEVDQIEFKKWQDFMNENCLSNANWSVSDKNEAASIFKAGTNPGKKIDPNRLTQSGKLVYNWVKIGPRFCK